jgi:hypothetical protein
MVRTSLQSSPPGASSVRTSTLTWSGCSVVFASFEPLHASSSSTHVRVALERGAVDLGVAWADATGCDDRRYEDRHRACQGRSNSQHSGRLPYADLDVHRAERQLRHTSIGVDERTLAERLP